MEMAQIAVIGLSFRSAPLAVREKLSVGVCSAGTDCHVGEHRQELLADIPLALQLANGRCAWLQEWVLLSTCNRIELYTAAAPGLDELAGFDKLSRFDEPLHFDLHNHLDQLSQNGGLTHFDKLNGRGEYDVRSMLVALLAEVTGVDPAVFSDYTYFHQGQAASRHLLRVATGLESLVLGEPQILGQVSKAYKTAVENKSTGPVLTELFLAAIRSGKRARTETTISKNAMSMSSMAIAQAQSVAGDLTHKNCLIVGLGEMGRLTLQQLQARGVAHISLVNRTFERAAQLGRQHGQKIYHWPELAEALRAADVVFSATGAADIVITPDLLDAVMVERQERPLIMLDIAVPRDIAPDVRQIAGVHLWDADELQGNLDGALAAREEQIPQVEHLIDEELELLPARLRMLAVKPVVVRLREKAEEIRRQELARTLNHLGTVDEQTLEHFQFLSRSLVNKLLHEPTVRLKDKASRNQANGYVQAINELFDLE